MRPAALVILAVLGSGPAASQDRVALRYDWPTSGTVEVAEFRVRRDTEAETAYTLRISPDGNGGGVRIAHEGFRFTRLGEVDLDDPAVRRALAPSMALARAIPDLLVDGEGRFVEFAGYEETIDRTVEFLVEQSGRTEAEGRRLRLRLDDPLVRRSLEATSAVTWDLWVGAWLGLEIEVGRSQETTVERPVGERVVTARVEFDCRERLDVGGRPAVRLRRIETATLEGDDLDADTARLFLAGGPGVPPGAIRRATRRTTIDAVLEIDTMRPHQVRTTTGFEVVLDDREAPYEADEPRNFTFAWPR